MKNRKMTIDCKLIFGCLLSLQLLACSKSKEVPVQHPIYHQLVNPFIGTGSYGNVYPGATFPFGMVQLSPDNGPDGWHYIAGYYYPDSCISAFSHTHLQGTGAGDMYDIAYMPFMEGEELPVHPSFKKTYAIFSHKDETASAGYYSVRLKHPKHPNNLDRAIDVELTASARTGAIRIHYPPGVAALQLDLQRNRNWDKTKEVKIVLDDQLRDEVKGYRNSTGWAPKQHVCFYSKFSQPYDSVVYQRSGDGLATFFFHMPKGGFLTVHTALSPRSVDDALGNLYREGLGFDFDGLRSYAAASWDSQLARIAVEGGPLAADTVFYTALYRALSCPNLFSDLSAPILMPDGKELHPEPGQEYYSGFSFWDTFRASHPLFQLLVPEDNKKMMHSILLFAKHNKGRLPVWPLWGQETGMMIGNHAIPVLVSAYLRGDLSEQDPRELLHDFVATLEAEGDPEMLLFKKFAYLPYDALNKLEWSVSKSIEHSLDAAAVADFIEAALRRETTLTEEEEREWKSLERRYRQRSVSYRNLYDVESGFFVPKDKHGQKLETFDPFAYSEHYCESNAWQYLFAAQHDVQGLIKLMGLERFRHKLDQLFSLETPKGIKRPIFATGLFGQYAHGNEPVQHCIYLYNAAEQPWKAADLLHKVLTQLYRNCPEGLCGNDDCGQMSAWYVFSAMGLYPLHPWSGRYELTTPLFDKVSMRLSQGKTFTIQVHRSAPKALYIRSAYLNGKPLKRSYLRYEDLIAGGTLELETTEEEGIVWWKED